MKAMKILQKDQKTLRLLIKESVKMLSFRQKILVTFFLMFLLVIGLLFPFAHRTVKDIAFVAMDDRANDLIERIRNEPDDDDLVTGLKDQKSIIFFRVAVITNEKKVIYDSHVKRVLGDTFDPEYIVNHPEVNMAFEKGAGYSEEYSKILDQEFAYFAKAFNFHGKIYVLRIAFPLKYVEAITKDFEIGVFGSAAFVLLLFSTMTWFIINYLTRPIQQINKAILPFQQGLTNTVPEITLSPKGRTDEFGKLADTLNSLSVRIRGHIDSLMHAKDEKEAILESLVEGVVSIDKNLIIEYANTMAIKLLQTKLRNLQNQPFTPEMQENCYHILKRSLEENMTITEMLEIKKKGEKSYLNVVATPTRDGTGAILVIQDTTEHYKLIEMRKDFIANASHELKTPITIIRGFAEALHDNPDLDKNIAEEITGKIVKNCERMTILIKDLLTITDIERIPEARLFDCDLEDLVESCVESVHDAFPHAKIQIQRLGDHELHLLADPNLLDLAITNLLTNAINYSNKPADVKVILGEDSGFLKLSVVDKGLGIPEKDLENIFQRFYQVDKARSKKVGGSGLGLSIVEMIVTKHFGRIEVTSELGIGSTFTMILPSQKQGKLYEMGTKNV
jgi:two-component system phosphate regulon sensor histidine kinase PhoR